MYFMRSDPYTIYFVGWIRFCFFFFFSQEMDLFGSTALAEILNCYYAIYCIKWAKKHSRPKLN